VTAAFGQFREYRTFHRCHIEHGLDPPLERVEVVERAGFSASRALSVDLSRFFVSLTSKSVLFFSYPAVSKFEHAK
jgi:hypothetical protein